MNTLRKTDFNAKTVCATAYKTLLLLKFLLSSPLQISQLISWLNQDPVIEEEITEPQFKKMVADLKAFGCKIRNPILFNNKRYILEENPFLITLSKDETALLNKFRQNPYEKNDWKNLLFTHSLMNKLCLIFNNRNQIHSLKHVDALCEADPNMIFELEKCCKRHSTVVFRYQSGFSLCNFEMITSFLKYEKDKLYVWGFSPNFDDFSYLRVDKIKSMKIYKEFSVNVRNKKVIRFKMFNPHYILGDNEILIEKTDEYLIIDFLVNNDFHAIQKFLELGKDCQILSPETFREDFLEIVKNIKKGYEDA